MASAGSQIVNYLIATQALDLLTCDLDIMLVDSTYVHDKTDDYVDDNAAAHEISVSGYVRKTVTTGDRSLTRDDGIERIKFILASAITWTTLGSGQTIGGIIGLVPVTNDADSPVIFFGDTNDLATSGNDVRWTPPANGVLQF